MDAPRPTEAPKDQPHPVQALDYARVREHQPLSTPQGQINQTFDAVAKRPPIGKDLSFTPNDWGIFAHNTPGADPWSAKPAEATPGDIDKKKLLDNSASPQERLAAAERIAPKGSSDTQFTVQDQKGGSHTYRIERENLDGKRSMVNVFEKSDDGKQADGKKQEYVMLRAVSNGDGTYQKQHSANGREANFDGDWWRHNAARFSSGDSGRRESAPQNDTEHQGRTGRDHHQRHHRTEQRVRRDSSKSDQGPRLRPSRDGVDHHLDQPSRVLSGEHVAHATGYYPKNDAMEGGYYDQKSSKKDPRVLHTLQDFLEHKPGLDGKPVKEVTVAMDNIVPYGQKIIIPELDRKYAKELAAIGYEHIPFVKKDTGSAFTGRGYGRMDICTNSKAESYKVDSNYKYQFVDSWGHEGNAPDQNTHVAIDQTNSGDRYNQPPQLDTGKRKDAPIQNNELPNPIQAVTEFTAKLVESAIRVAESMTPGFNRRKMLGENQLCATGVQRALLAAGDKDFVGTGDGWHMHHAFEQSGKYQQVPQSEAQPGDIGVRRQKGHPNNYGHVFTVVGKDKHGHLLEASDHISQYNPDNPLYDENRFYRRVKA